MIRLTLAEPIMPEGAALTAEITGEDDIKLLTDSVNAAYAESEKSGASRSTVRQMDTRIDEVERLVRGMLPPMKKLEMANAADRA